jgi:hypothetical protein
MNSPRRGPWFASGAKMIGPKNPATKLTPPTTTPPRRMELSRPAAPDAKQRQTYQATPNAQAVEPTSGAQSDVRLGMMRENGTQYTK